MSRKGVDVKPPHIGADVQKYVGDGGAIAAGTRGCAASDHPPRHSARELLFGAVGAEIPPNTIYAKRVRHIGQKRIIRAKINKPRHPIDRRRIPKRKSINKNQCNVEVPNKNVRNTPPYSKAVSR